jgi:ribonuclease HI
VSDGVFALFFDGGRRSGSGETGCGAWARFPDGPTVFEGHWYLGNRTLSSNAAEYEGLVRGFRALLQQVVSYSRSALVIVGDSQLVVEQCSGNYAVRAPHLQPYVETVRGLVREWKHRVVFRRTPRALNAQADSLANRAMDTRGSAVVVPAFREDVVDFH